MKSSSIAGILFIAMMTIQLYVPIREVIRKERVWHSGITAKMQLAPIDPSDPFRGKFITLSFRENTIDVSTRSEWKAGQEVYVFMKPDNNRLLHIDHLGAFYSEDKNLICLKATIQRLNDKQGYKEVRLLYPFEQFYMEESKAPKAEEAYQSALRDSSTIAYGLLSVYKGEAVIRDILIGEKSLIK